MNRKLALMLGEKRYTGRPCPKHPALAGERVTNDCRCIGCKRDAKREARLKAKSKKLGDLL